MHERKYNQNILEKLERICKDNHWEFCPQMKRLGPRKVNTIPMKVYDINGNITTDIRNILHEWKINFEKLLNRQVDAGFNDEFYYECLQNGFRHKRSCEEHIYTLTSSIRNRLSQNQSTYCCFIDKQKAFEWVDRDLCFINS